MLVTTNVTQCNVLQRLVAHAQMCVNLSIFHEFHLCIYLSNFFIHTFIIATRIFISDIIHWECILLLTHLLFSSILSFSFIVLSLVHVFINICQLWQCKLLSRNCYYYIMLMESCNMSANNDETRFSRDHNSPCDGKAALLSVFRTRGSFYPPFIIR